VRVRDDVVRPGENKKLKSDFKDPYDGQNAASQSKIFIPGFNFTSRPYNSIVSTMNKTSNTYVKL